MKGKIIVSTPAATSILAIGQGKGKTRKGPPKQNLKGKSQAGSSSNEPKGKSNSNAHPVSGPKEATCFYSHDTELLKQSYLKYLQDIKDG